MTCGSWMTIASNCHKLRKIDLENAELITDDAIGLFSFYNPDLEDIKLHNCPLLTFVYWLGFLFDKLKKVDISNMPLMTDEGLMHLLSYSHDLVEICLTKCPLRLMLVW